MFHVSEIDIVILQRFSTVIFLPFYYVFRESVGHFLERVAGEFNQLQFHVNQSKGHPIIDKIKSVCICLIFISFLMCANTFLSPG